MNSNDLTLANAIAQAPNPRVAEAIRNAAAKSQQQHNDAGGKLSLRENASLQTLKRQMAEAQVERQHVAKNGGERAMQQKARATEMLQRQNEHGGK
jgi:hypothetical protein